MFNLKPAAQTLYTSLLTRAYDAVREGRLSVPRYMAAQRAALVRIHRAFAATGCYVLARD